MPVHEADAGVLVEQSGCSAQCARSNPVVSGEKDGVIAVSTVEQPFVVRRDMTSVNRMSDYLNPRIISGELFRHISAVIGGGVIDHNDPNIYTLLRVECATNGAWEKSSIIITRNYNAD
jgi:hypothetical protein